MAMSNPTIDQMSQEEIAKGIFLGIKTKVEQERLGDFEKQWGVFRDAVKTTGINLNVIDQIIVCLLQINGAGGYGHISLYAEDGKISSLKVEVNKPPGETIMRMDKTIVK